MALSPLLDRLREPGANRTDLDSEERLDWHRSIVARKRLTRDVFRECQQHMRVLADTYLAADGAAVELGAGVAPMRDLVPDVISTDIVYARHLDCVIDAGRMAFRAGSVRVVYAQNAFHHFPEPRLFLSELERVLVPGGGAVLLEPYHGPLASFVFRRLFRSEGFDKSYTAWETPATGPMNGANQALSYVVFVRDRCLFREQFPTLAIIHQEPLANYLRYLASGGLNFRQLLPDASSGLLGLVEQGLRPLRRWFALHHVIVLRKAAE